jgi:hypothetical protein
MFGICSGIVPALPQFTWDDTLKKDGRVYDSVLGEAYQDNPLKRAIRVVLVTIIRIEE